MIDYYVWYNGCIIGNLQADNDKQAQKRVDNEYSEGVYGKPTAVRS